MRVRTSILLICVLLLAVAAPARAQDSSDPEKGCTSTASGGLPDTVGIGNGFFIAEATITPPNGAAVRTLDACAAAVFVQSWLARATYGPEDMLRDPPPEAPVYRVDVKADWNGMVGYLTVYYAEADGTPFIAWNQEQGIPPEPADPPPAPDPWFTGLPRVIDAFNGDAELIETQGVIDATSTTTTPGAATTENTNGATDDGSGSGSPWVWVAGAAAVVVVGGGLVLRRRRS